MKPTKVGPMLSESVKPESPGSCSPAGAPNVLVLMRDDVGFGADDAGGLCWRRDLNTGPTTLLQRTGSNTTAFIQRHYALLRGVALITGRNHHTDATGIIMEFSSPYAGYNSLLSKSAGSVGKILTDNGYGTAWLGKNHNIPDWETTPAGPYDLWPTGGLGFQYFYGFFGADAHQYYPAVYENTTPIDPYLGKKNYHFDSDMADHAINWIHTEKAVSPDKPFFAYYTPGATHAPHQVPKEWADKFKGKFDMGWDKLREMIFEQQKAKGIIPPDTVLNPTPKDYVRWDSLSPAMKKVCAREMEVYAGYLAFTDYNIGRVIQSIKDEGQLDNTLIIYIQGDNGASAEDPTGYGMTSEIGVLVNGLEDTEKYMTEHIADFGGPWMQNHYSHGWAHAMNTPYQWDKKVASHLGGTRTSMVVSWPNRIKHVGEMRSQFVHITDIVPTILEAANIPAPETIDGIKQQPMAGTSIAYTWTTPRLPKNTQHSTSIIANRAIYHDGWMANTTPKRLPWVSQGATTPDPVKDYQW